MTIRNIMYRVEALLQQKQQEYEADLQVAIGEGRRRIEDEAAGWQEVQIAPTPIAGDARATPEPRTAVSNPTSPEMQSLIDQLEAKEQEKAMLMEKVFCRNCRSLTDYAEGGSQETGEAEDPREESS